jgi:hypothetical protein
MATKNRVSKIVKKRGQFVEALVAALSVSKTLWFERTLGARFSGNAQVSILSAIERLAS